MVRKPFRVGELGVGLRAKKLVDLAIKHPFVEFVGVDKEDTILYGKYLRDRGQKIKPANLQVKRKTDAVSFLKSQPNESFSHLYCHFLLQHLGFDERYSLYPQIMRTLKPGTSFAIVDEVIYNNQVLFELKQYGFIVSMKRITAMELLRLGTDNAKRNALSIIEKELMYESLPEKFSGAIQHMFGWKDKQELMQWLIAKTKREIRKKLKEMPGNNSEDAKKAIRRILLHIPDMYSKEPFVVISAKKPKGRPIQL